ncbi:unnamed protein product [Prorocentrum cordatum]|uniref:Cytochrome c domain-containing protein n=1 Tax=Prorocentrum cordatum TaxID=2364126 RepID=A0ABN9PMX4_9DINO|nr:unnamed protein product [Polarella glacialis]
MAPHSEPAEKATAAPEELQEQNGGENTPQPKEDVVVQKAADRGSGRTDAVFGTIANRLATAHRTLQSAGELLPTLLEHSGTVQHQLYAQRDRVAMTLARTSASKSFNCHEEMERAHTTVPLKRQIEELTAAIDKCREVGAYLTDASRLHKGLPPWELDYTRCQCDEMEGFCSKRTHSDHGWGHDEVAKDGAPTMGGGAVAETAISIQPQGPPQVPQSNARHRRERRLRAGARRRPRQLQGAQRLDAHHGSQAPKMVKGGAKAGSDKAYVVRKACGEWWWSTRLEATCYQCKCRAALPKPKSPKADWGGSGGSSSTSANSGKGPLQQHSSTKSTPKGADKVSQALKLLTDTLGDLNLSNGEAISRTLQGAAAAIKAAVPEPPPKSRAQRLGIAAKALQEANQAYSSAFAAKKRADAAAQEARTKLDVKAAAVLKVEKELEDIQAEGRDPPKGVLEQLVSGQVEELAAGQLAADIERELNLTAADLDEEGRKQVEEVKKTVVAQMKENAQAFSTQLKGHLAAEKLKAAEQQATIHLAAKKRLWMAKQKIGQGYDAYAFQETHVGRSNLDSVECELVKLGYKACFTAARQSTVTKATTDVSGEWKADLDLCDWTPVTWHLKGTTITAISLYLDVGKALPEGINHESMIDYALVNEQGQKLIKGVEAVYDVPWKPHIGLKFTLYAEDFELALDSAQREALAPVEAAWTGFPAGTNPGAEGAVRERIGGKESDENLGDGLPGSTWMPANPGWTDADADPFADLEDHFEEELPLQIPEGFEAEVPDEPRGHDADYVTNTVVDRTSQLTVDAEAAKELGDRFANTIGTMERFYCMAYRIDLVDRHHFMGRGKAYELKVTNSRECGERRLKYSEHSADWRARAEVLLTMMAKLRRRGRGTKQQRELARAGRELAYDGMPQAGRGASETARLHRSIWRQRLAALEDLDVAIAEGMAMQAEQERRAAVNRDLRESTRSFGRWLAATEKQRGVLHRITKPPIRREEELAMERGVTDSPMEIVDAKAEASAKIWRCEEAAHGTHTQLLGDPRRRAAAVDAPQWTVDDLNLALAGVVEKMAGLVARAEAGVAGAPAFWLRGLTPKAWTVPPPCSTEEQETPLGQCLQGGRLRAPEGGRLTICGDGSGGEYSSDVRHRRCGWSWVMLDTRGRTRDFPTWAAKFGPLPGSRQSNNRAELWSLINCLEPTCGGMTFWTDSEITLVGWHARRDERPEGAANCDLWRRVRRAIAERGGGREIITLRHLDSHLTETEDAMERRPTENKELKMARRHAVMQRRAQRKVKADYFARDPRRRPATTHDLVELRRGRCVEFNGHTSHPSHPLRWLGRQRRWFCTLCASSATEMVSDKLQAPCRLRPTCESRRYLLKSWTKLAGAEEWRMWPEIKQDEIRVTPGWSETVEDPFADREDHIEEEQPQQSTKGLEAEVPDEPSEHDADFVTNMVADRTSQLTERTHTLGNRQTEREGEGLARGCHVNREHSERHSRGTSPEPEVRSIEDDLRRTREVAAGGIVNGDHAAVLDSDQRQPLEAILKLKKVEPDDSQRRSEEARRALEAARERARSSPAVTARERSPPKPKVLPLATLRQLLAALFKKHCSQCHTIRRDGVNPYGTLWGPNLYGIIGRTAGQNARTGWSTYSRAVEGSGILWTERNLVAFLKNPRAFAGGVINMNFRGLDSIEDRIDLVHYMKRAGMNWPPPEVIAAGSQPRRARPPAPPAEQGAQAMAAGAVACEERPLGAGLPPGERTPSGLVLFREPPRRPAARPAA